ncbi:uncharacterized protein CEXT_378281 [Caerostris extrusa]|uniref:Uncharacterized protein n=1 Tax=Caerostris extrusa TaxID=172846 RepID=A0AAV4PS00_CAEEX|nr:uncharacterized protein CEXT_378281 [Caerostris extrusa]
MPSGHVVMWPLSKQSNIGLLFSFRAQEYSRSVLPLLCRQAQLHHQPKVCAKNDRRATNQTLFDIQEFYEITLLDDTKSIQQKTAETLQIASKWENSPPLAGLTPNNEKYRYKDEVDAETGGYKDIPELDGFPRNIVERGGPGEVHFFRIAYST